ncbi:MAG TPA: hypothetical protein VF656_20770 [Pyrinomonadaceae bacterium]
MTNNQPPQGTQGYRDKESSRKGAKKTVNLSSQSILCPFCFAPLRELLPQASLTQSTAVFVIPSFFRAARVNLFVNFDVINPFFFAHAGESRRASGR